MPTNIDFTHRIQSLSNTPLLDAQGQPMTLANAAVSLLSAMVPASGVEAQTAIGLAERIQKGGPAIALSTPEMAAVKKAITTNAAQLPALAIARLAQHLGFTGCHAK
jgi:hypothetical protein